MKTVTRMWAVAAAVSLAGATGCTDGSGNSSAPPVTSSSASAPASTHADAIITVRDFQYEVPSSVKPGSLVTVTNMDSTPHTLTDRNAGGFDVEIPGGETAILQAPDSHGEYGFTCIFHPKMKGTLVVK